MARIQKNLLLTPNDIAKFQKLAEKAQQITIENLKKDEEYEDAPDEFIGKFLKKIIAFSYSRISVNKKSGRMSSLISDQSRTLNLISDQK